MPNERERAPTPSKERELATLDRPKVERPKLYEVCCTTTTTPPRSSWSTC